MKVCKFGGSSLSCGEKFKKVKEIILKDKERKIIVVSAIGKKTNDEHKITDLLFLTYSHIRYHFDYMPILDEVKNRYLSIVKELNIDIDLDKEFSLIIEKIKNGITEEELVSYGEYLSAIIMASYLNFRFIDARDIIKFNYEGHVDEEKTFQLMSNIEVSSGIVIPGFYGEYPNSNICLFSRGGSDVTGSFVARGFKADYYENFTDVSGVYMANPSIIENPRKIDAISYSELRELSYSGANVLHEEAIIPLEDYPIPIIILNTDFPEDKGTLIQKNVLDKTYLLTGIAGKKDFTSFTFIKKRSTDKLSVILDVLNVFNRYHVPIEHIPTSIDSFSVVVEKSKMEKCYYDLIADFKRINDILDIKEDDDIALVTVVGRNMIEKPGTSGRILSVFGNEKINIKLIAQGREEINIIIGISNKDYEKSIKALYSHFAFESIK